MRARTGGIVLTALLVCALALWLIWPDLREQPIAEAPSPPATAKQIEAGRYLARAGNCIACHTVPGQAEYSGARGIPTPFGTLYSTNLTPDPETGLGNWSSAEFYRALRYGKSRDGRRLYPAFPYPNYTRVSREDSDALFAFLQSLPPVRQAPPASTLRFPYNTQIALMAWRALYFDTDVPAPQEQSETWQRGEYLVEGLGHCNACHTPRGALGGLRSNAGYAGGPIPMLAWDALPLASTTTMSDGDAQEMIELLKNGTSRRNVTTGPMAEVVFHSLQHLNEPDIAAIVEYIRSLPPPAYTPPARALRVSERQQEAQMATGSEVYRKHCADCHGDDGQGQPHVYPALAGNRLVTAASPTNAIQTVLYGGYAPSTAGHPRPHGMPPYSHQLSKADIAAVLTYIRGSWGNEAAAVSSVDVERY